MKIAIVSMDTRGGVQPYVALARGLCEAGHEVRAIAPADLASMFEGSGASIATLSASIESVVRGTSATEKGALASIALAARELPKRIGTFTREALAACEGVDVITGGIGGMVVALSVAEKVGARFVETHLQPVGASTDAYPGAMFAGVPSWSGALGMRASHWLSEQAIWLPFAPLMKRARREVLGLSGAARAHLGQPVLYGFSPRVVPVPAAGEGQRARIVTGYWFLPAPAAWRPSPELEAFVSAGGPLVSIGFGSMSSDDPAKVTELVASAVRSVGARAVLLSGWGALREVSGGDLFCAEAIPHDWLFAKMKAVVHHGGAGTTGASLRSGAVSIVVPFTMDQPFWAARVEQLGVGPTPIARKKLDRDSLARALDRALSDRAMQARASELGEAIRGEDGVGNAVRAFNALA
ncbi:MAG: glycosyltransferase [Polyangiales bacterium]